MKKTLATGLALVFASLLFCFTTALAADQRVFDDAGLLTAEEIAALEQQADTFRTTYSIDMVLVTTADAGGLSAAQYAENYFATGPFGTGSYRDGTLMLIDMDNRECYIYTYGLAEDILDPHIESLLDAVTAYLPNGDYSGAFSTFVTEAGSLFAAQISVGSPEVAATGQRVFDSAGLLTAEQAATLQQQAETFENKYDMDMVLVTTGYASGRTAQQYAEDFFTQNGFGRGSRESGVLMLVDTDNQQYYVYTQGLARDYFDSKIDSLLSALEPLLNSQSYYEAFTTFVSEATSRAKTATGISPTEWVIIVAVPLAILAIGYFSVRAKYGRHPTTLDYPLRERSTLSLYLNQDSLVNVVRTQRHIPRPTNTGGGGFSGGGGGGGSFSGGRSGGSSGFGGGGGGRKF
ncbi:MAG: TPM domain-containing protein [Oscillospiraceae bacterium]